MNLVSKVAEIGREQTTYEFDEEGRLLKINNTIEGTGEWSVTEYVYDSEGFPIEMIEEKKNYEGDLEKVKTEFVY